jgi:hypothetical protein
MYMYGCYLYIYLFCFYILIVFQFLSIDFEALGQSKAESRGSINQNKVISWPTVIEGMLLYICEY